MKKLLIGLLLILLIVVGVYFYFFQLTPIKKNNPLAAVPSDAIAIIQLDDPLHQWQKLTDNKIWEFIKNDPSLKQIGHSIDSTNAEIKKNSILWELVASRPMVISVHRVKEKEIDFLYTIDLQKATQLTFFKNYIEKAIGDQAKVFTRKYGNTEIIEYSYLDSPETYYLSVTENLLSISETHTLIEASISERVSPVLIRDLDFIDVGKYLNTDNISVYLNHKEFVNYSKLLLNSENEFIKDLASSKFTSFDFQTNDEFITLNGFSTMPEGDDSFLNALLKSGKSEVKLGEIVPEYASSFVSINFSDADEFYKNLVDVINKTDDGPSYTEGKNKIEKFLDISFEDDFVSWISDEIGIIQLNSSSSKANVEVAIAIRHNGLESVKQHLEYLEKQIKKKTPVKFKGIDYKGYNISYLSIKGFFKIFFGKLFKEIDKPYYTIMDEYVVFSNSPKTLGKIITSKVENKTLDNTAHYAEFMHRFKPKSNLLAYFDTQNLLLDATRLMDSETNSLIKKHYKYIKGFPLMGFQLSEYDNLITHTIDMEYFPQSDIIDYKSKKESIVGPEFNQLNMETESDDYVISVENILPEDLNDKVLEETYSNGQLKFEVPLKDGRKHGRYVEYDSLGNLIIKGRYKDDEQTGTWKFYDANGELIEKKKY